MKKKVLQVSNILLGGLIAALGFGCGTQKKMGQTQPSDRNPDTVMCLYGIPTYLLEQNEGKQDTIAAVPQDTVSTAAQETVPTAAQDSVQTAISETPAAVDHSQIRVKYGVMVPR